MEVANLAHIGLFVEDVDRSIAFYENNLGFACFYGYDNALEDGLQRIRFIRNGTCVIELIELPKALQRQDGLFDHIAIACKDIDAVIETLRENGVALEEETYADARHVFPNGSKWILFRGPDHEHLELTEVF